MSTSIFGERVGQHPAASSEPVVLPLDQTPIPVFQNGSWLVGISNFPVTQQVAGTVTISGGSLVATIDTTGLATSTHQVDGSQRVRITDGTNNVSRLYDVDSSGSTHEYVEGVNLRLTANGSSVEFGTASNPFRIDPVGTTVQPVAGSVTVTNFPAMSGTIHVDNFPVVQQVAGSVTINGTTTSLQGTNPWSVAGSVAVTNFPATQSVAGTIHVDNFPATQQVAGTVTVNGTTTVTQGTNPWVTDVTDRVGRQLGHTVVDSGSVTVTNFPATQQVAGTVTVNGSVVVGIVDIAGIATAANQVNGNHKTQIVDIGGVNLGTPSNPIRVDTTGTTVQPVSGSITVLNFPAMSGTIHVDNFPAIQEVSGSIAATVLNFPTNQQVFGTVTVNGTTTVLQGTDPWVTDVTDRSARVLGHVVVDSGSVVVTNLPSTQTVAGTIHVDNFPSVQTVAGTVTVNGTTTVTQGTNPWTDDVTDRATRLLGHVTVDNFPATVAVTQSTSPWVTSGSVVASVLNFPAVQEVAGTVTVNGTVVANIGTDDGIASAANQINGSQKTQIVDGSNVNLGTVSNPIQVGGSVTTHVDNFPTTQTIAGTIHVDNFPASQTVNGTVTVNGTTTVNQGNSSTIPWLVDVTDRPARQLGVITGSTTSFVNNFPATQTVNGTVTVNGTATVTQGTNPWITQVSNFPATQTVNGTVTVNGTTTVNQGNSSTIPWLTDATDRATRQLGIVSGSLTTTVLNFPATVTVNGTTTVNQGNSSTIPWLTDTTDRAARLLGVVSGSVTSFVNNFPSTQTVNGTVTVNGTTTVNQGNSSTNPWLTNVTDRATRQLGVVSGSVVVGVVDSGANATSANQTNGSQRVRITDGTNNVSRIFDLDTSGSTHEYIEGVNLRGSASGGSFELGTLTHPLVVSSSGTSAISLGTSAGKTNVLKTGNVTTTATTADQVVLTYTVTTGKTFYVQYLSLYVRATAIPGNNNTPVGFGSISLETPSGTKGLTNDMAMGSTTGQTRFIYTFAEPIPIASGVVIRVVCTPSAATSFLWEANFGGYEK